MHVVAWYACGVFGVAMCISGCGKDPTVAKEKSAPPFELNQWLAKSTGIDWLKAKTEQGAELATKAKAALDSIKTDELRQQALELTKALDTKDWSQIDGMAQQIGKQLSAEKLSEGLRFVVIQRQKGGEAATKAIEEYAARQDLNEYEKAAAKSLQKGLSYVQRDDVQGYVVLAVFFACECKLGAHQGGLLAVPIISILFPDYDSKHSGNFKP
jgi:hypothetical protein